MRHRRHRGCEDADRGGRVDDAVTGPRVDAGRPDVRRGALDPGRDLRRRPLRMLGEEQRGDAGDEGAAIDVPDIVAQPSRDTNEGTVE